MEILQTLKISKREVFEDDLRHMNTDSDSEAMLNVFAHELQKIGKLRPSKDDIFSAVEAVHRRCSGGYAVVAMIANYGIVGFRDPHGIRLLYMAIVLMVKPKSI